MKKFTILLVTIFFLLSISAFSQDTFSIVAVDSVTGEVGSAGASCLDESNIHGGCSIISDVHPGIGAIHTQAYWLQSNQNYAKRLMDSGYYPSQIIDSLINNDAEFNPGIRQYGIVGLYNGKPFVKGYTGENCNDFKGHIEGKNYCIQGNILLGEKVLDSMEAGFLNTPGDLACKLMGAMRGAKMPGADTRCFSSGNSSLSSFLRVAKPGDSPDSLYINIIVPLVPYGFEPIDSLQFRLDKIHFCSISKVNEENISNDFSVIISYDPLTLNTSIKINGNNEFEHYKVELFDCYGRLAMIFRNIDSGNLVINHKELIRGLYFYKISFDGFNCKTGEILIY